MWEILARFILRQRTFILVVLAMLTMFMVYKSTENKLQWTLPKLLPDSDSTLVEYEAFKDRYGQEAMAFLFAIEENPLDSLALFNEWYALSKRIEQIHGVDTVVAVNRLLNVVKDSDKKEFRLQSVVDRPLANEQELDSVRALIHSMPFYKNKIYNDDGVSFMAVSLNVPIFDSPAREPLIDAVLKEAESFEENTGIDLVYSGLPYIRASTTRLIKSELQMFIVLAIAVTILILTLFFRSAPPVLVSMLIVAMGVVWSMGIIAILGYEMTILTSIIPPLVIVIGIPNSVYLINKYHAEYNRHRNKVLALTRIIKKIGKATLMTNLTTAIGFLAFVFTQSAILVEFGVVASINIVVLFVLSIFLVPTIFSYLPPPKDEHMRHLQVTWVGKVVAILENLVSGHRTKIYWVAGILVVVGIYGITRIITTGNLVDDLPEDSQIVTDLHYFEDQFDGVMPFEISIDAKKPGKASKRSTLKRIERVEELLAEYPEFSKPLSIADGIKFVRQAYYGGNPAQYKLISSQEQVFFKPYIDNMSGKKGANMLRSFIDSTEQYTRISTQMRDVGTIQMDSLIQDLKPKVEEIFPADKYDVSFTGTSIVYLKGTNYLVNNLIISLLLAIGIIAVIMALLFTSIRMVAMSIFTNLIPLIFTGAMMGYFGIALKPSTILVFSIAFGISIDDTIHFLAKYRQELIDSNWNIREAVLKSVRETGVSMIYTSIILFFGFSVFSTSQFGGTQALGILVSITLLIAMLANLVLLPSFLMTLDKGVTQKSFKEPFAQLLDEEDDIDYDFLTIREDDPQITESSPSNKKL